MRQNLEYRTVIGALIWIGIIAVSIIFARQSLNRSPDATKQLAQFIGKQQTIVEINLPAKMYLKVGDQVYEPGTERVSPVGYVSRIDSTDNTNNKLAYSDQCFITFYGSAPTLNDGDFLKYHSAPDSTAWVLQTMFPPEKKEEISKLILASYRKNQAKIVTALRPVVEASLKDATSVIREDLKAAFEAREDKIKTIGQRYQKDLVEEDIIPLIKNEIWPIVSDESRPLADEIGQEIWGEVSMFRFGWRYIYDKTPLPDKKLTEKEFKRFVDEKALPILENHIGDIVELQKSLVKKISANDKVKETMSNSFKEIVSDPEVQDMMSEVFREVFVNNEKLQGALEERWSQPEAQYAVSLTNRMLEPTIAEIGVALFGSPDTKITPEFARVLRHRILHKDNRWFTLHQPVPGSDEPGTPRPKTLPVEIATEQDLIPYAPARDTN